VDNQLLASSSQAVNVGTELRFELELEARREGGIDALAGCSGRRSMPRVGEG
jgi:hypothetical protein